MYNSSDPHHHLNCLFLRSIPMTSYWLALQEHFEERQRSLIKLPELTTFSFIGKRSKKKKAKKKKK